MFSVILLIIYPSQCCSLFLLLLSSSSRGRENPTWFIEIMIKNHRGIKSSRHDAFIIFLCFHLQYRCSNLKLVIRQVGAVVVYTYVFQMLAPPAGETFDSLEEKLPTMAPVNAVPEQVPLQTSEEPETMALESSKRGEVRLFPSVSHSSECMIQDHICVRVFLSLVLLLLMVFLILNSKYCILFSKLVSTKTSSENLSKGCHPLDVLGNLNNCVLRGGLSQVFRPLILPLLVIDL